ncbi:E3 ubiquitin-protein ligase hrd1 [Actinomortierella wolfii]|nr:E3 ubiquitin-protein ligase hrd1 [Actinomortierella wolfii]
MARLAVYGAVSTALATSVILVAFAQRSNFYSACIYLYKSNACMMILLNFGLFLTLVLGQFIQWIFFGTLRPLEVEHLYERAWYTITETCLAMTIFRDEFDTRFVVMFTILLFLKVFHWLCQDRVDSMEQSPGLPASFHVRMVSMMSLLIYIDVLMVSSAISHFFLSPPNMMIMFAFEYTLLATSLAASFGKYTLHTIDMRSEEPWDNKSMLLFYLDLLADFVKLATYLMFFMVILIYYGLPVHIIRDVYMTLRSFLQKCKDLIQYRMATRNMNERYPDATPADLAALSDPICIICREEMICAQPAGGDQDANGNPRRPATPRSGTLSSVPKKLPCGHIFHFQCLKSWLERQQSCPTCRRMVLDSPAQGAGQPAAGDGAPAAGGVAGGAAGAAAGAAGVNGVPNMNGQPNGAPVVPGQAGGQAGIQGQGQPPHGVGFPIFFGLPHHHLAMGGIHPYFMGGIPAGGPVAVANPVVPAVGAGGAGEGRQQPGPTIPNGTPAMVPPNVPTYTIPHVTHPIPGLIPLFPVQHGHTDHNNQQHQHQHQHQSTSGSNTQHESPRSGSTITSAASTTGGSGGHVSSSTTNGATGSTPSSTGRRLATDHIPLTSLDGLSETQIHHLESNTRQALQERLRVLQAVEHQLLESITLLTQVISVLPPPPPPPPLQAPPQASEARDPPSPDLSAQDLGSNATIITSSSGMSFAMSTVGAVGLRRAGSWNMFGNANHRPSLSHTTTITTTATTTTAASSSTTATLAGEATAQSRMTTTVTSTTTSITSSSSSSSSVTVTAPIPSIPGNVSLLSAIEASADNHFSPTANPREVAADTADTVGYTTNFVGDATPDLNSTSRSVSKTAEETTVEPTKIDKGKGKKDLLQEDMASEAEALDPASLASSTLTATDLSDFAKEEEEEEDEDESSLSPQEMVRRRWARLQQQQDQ